MILTKSPFLVTFNLSTIKDGVLFCVFFFFQAEDGIRDYKVTGVQTCALPISCRAIHSSAGLSLSGAGPYAIVSKISETVVMSYHGMVMRRGIAPGHKVLELALDVGEQRRGTEPEQTGPQPALAQLFLHEDEPVERLFRLADPARRLEPARASRALVIVADLSRHDHADGEGRVHCFFTGGRLDEVRPGHHRDLAGARHVHEGRQVARAEDHLHVGVAAGLAEGAHLVV